MPQNDFLKIFQPPTSHSNPYLPTSLGVQDDKNMLHTYFFYTSMNNQLQKLTLSAQFNSYRLISQDISLGPFFLHVFLYLFSNGSMLLTINTMDKESNARNVIQR